MREERNAQTSLFDPRAVDHPVADDLERASASSVAEPNTGHFHLHGLHGVTIAPMRSWRGRWQGDMRPQDIHKSCCK